MNENERNEDSTLNPEQQIKELFVGFLVILEDLKSEHDNTFHKLAVNFPEMTKTLIVSDYFDDDKLNSLRKKVFDLGNNCIRKTVKLTFSKKY